MSFNRDKVVFFAEVSNSMRNYKEILVQELRSAGCIVQEAPKDLQDIGEVLGQCELAIHLLSNEDTEPNRIGKGIEESQIGLSVQRHLSERLIAGSADNPFEIYAWYPKLIDGKYYIEEKIPLHLRKIEQLEEVELFRTGFEDFKYYLLNKIRSEQAEDLNEFFIKGANSRSIYFMYDFVDKALADNYINHLNRRGFNVLTPSFESDMLSAMKSHTKSLKKLDIAVVFAKEASVNWVNMKVVDLVKTPGLRRTKEILESAIISTPKKIKQMTPMTRSFKLISIENGGVMEQLEELLKGI